MDPWWNEHLGQGFPPRLRHLRRVVPIVQTAEHAGVSVALLSLDDYDEGFAVRLRLLLDDGHPIAEAERGRTEEGRAADLERGGVFAWMPPQPELSLEATDDRGTRYARWIVGGSWGPDMELRREWVYAPALGPDVCALRLAAAEVRWYRRETKTRLNEVIAVEPGPWSFVVPL